MVNLICRFHTCNQIYPQLRLNHLFHGMFELSSQVFMTFELQVIVKAYSNDKETPFSVYNELLSKVVKKSVSVIWSHLLLFAQLLCLL